MSQSHAVRGRHTSDHSDDLTKLDLLYAFLLHLLVISVVVILSYWQGHETEKPLQRIEVMMISAKQLAAIEQQSRRKVKPVKKQEKKPAAVKKPEIDKKKVPVLQLEQKKPVQKKEAKVEAKVEPKAAPKKVDEDFDPFAPVASTTDRTESTLKASTSRPDIANLKGQQLSKNEIERYIALMQAAIQENWKVSANSGKVNTDPLVEINLDRNGDVASIKLLESSGSDLLDDSLFRAIKAAAPFQIPKAQYEYFQNLKFRFHPDK